MKKLIILSTAFLAITFALTSCEKEGGEIALWETTQGGDALLKINYASNYAANPPVQLEVNDVRVSGLVTGRTPFPGGGYNTGGSNYADYLRVTPGTVKVGASIPKKNTDVDSITLFGNNITLEAGKNYSAHVTDTGANTKVVLMVDDLTLPAAGSARYRFVNLMPNVPAVDLYYGTTLVAANVAYLSSSAYFTMPVFGTTAQAWTIRPAGAAPTSTALATYTSSGTIGNNRVYTAFALGYSGQTDAARKPYISFYLMK